MTKNKAGKETGELAGLSGENLHCLSAEKTNMKPGT